MENQLQEATDTQEKASTEPVKSLWQLEKESWYDHVPLTVRQLDIIIWTAVGLLVLVFLLIVLDATHII